MSSFPVSRSFPSLYHPTADRVASYSLEMLALFTLKFAIIRAFTSLQKHPEKGRTLGLRWPPRDMFVITNGSQVSDEIRIERPFPLQVSPAFVKLAALGLFGVM